MYADGGNQWADLSGCEQSMICAAFGDGREAMRGEACAIAHSFATNMIVEEAITAGRIATAICDSDIRALPGKEGE